MLCLCVLASDMNQLQRVRILNDYLELYIRLIERVAVLLIGQGYGLFS